ncbi:hypothetical protein KC640_00935 [Candidatus Dojkabacteria bacterium]|uniref:Uncharacterized protein n=1 Tax=Candidatus Dojkabacteria bacterium TaxID=2099670 RepID=A0A955I707_9BACT|nr:hypothetical protein [Candidatus Dojkabacteria bacterium]
MGTQKTITSILLVASVLLFAGAYLLFRQVQLPALDNAAQSSLVYMMNSSDLRWIWDTMQRQLTVSDPQGQKVFVEVNADSLFGLGDWVQIDIDEMGDKQLLSPQDCLYVAITVPLQPQQSGFRLGTNFNVECKATLWENELVSI